MKKKNFYTIPLMFLLLSLLVGCGSTIVVNLVGNDGYENAKAMEALSGPDLPDVVETEKMTPPSTEGWDESKKI